MPTRQKESKTLRNGLTARCPKSVSHLGPVSPSQGPGRALNIGTDPLTALRLKGKSLKSSVKSARTPTNRIGSTPTIIRRSAILVPRVSPIKRHLERITKRKRQGELIIPPPLATQLLLLPKRANARQTL